MAVSNFTVTKKMCFLKQIILPLKQYSQLYVHNSKLKCCVDFGQICHAVQVGGI